MERVGPDKEVGGSWSLGREGEQRTYPGAGQSPWSRVLVLGRNGHWDSQAGRALTLEGCKCCLRNSDSVLQVMVGH